MKDIITYALSVVVCSGLFMTFYRLVIHRRTPFVFARYYLWVSMIAAAVIPALDIPVWRQAPIEITLQPAAPVTDMAEAALMTQPLVQAFESSAATIIPTATLAAFESVAGTIPQDWAKSALWALYGIGIAVLGVVMTLQIRRIVRVRGRAEIHWTTECEIAISDEVGAPFTFLDTVYIERGTPEREIGQIVLHEASHIRHRHSHEKIAMEVIKNILWFNPFGWWAARLLAEVHEFEADRDVLDGGFGVEEYLPLLFRQIFGYIPELSVGLGNSLTKRRFLMMKNRITPKHPRLRVAGVLPLVAGLTALFSFTTLPPEIVVTNPEEMTDEASLIATPINELIEQRIERITPQPGQTAARIKERIEPRIEQAAVQTTLIAALVAEPVEPRPGLIGGEAKAATKAAPESVREAVAESVDQLDSASVRPLKVMIRDNRGRVLDNSQVMLTLEGAGELNNPDQGGNSWFDVTDQDRVSLLVGDNLYNIPVAGLDSMLIRYRGRLGSPAAEAARRRNRRVEIGYGAIRDRDNTTAVAQVDMTNSDYYNNLKDLIQGRVPGVYFMGETLVVRGPSSVTGGNDALVVVDGNPVGTFAEINNVLSPQSIASIAVLKDAGSTSIYGVRGSSGVVLITTKQ